MPLSASVDSEYTHRQPRVQSCSCTPGSMRLLFRVREREHAAVICQGLCLLRLRRLTSRSRDGRLKWNLTQPHGDVMRDILRLVDVDLLQDFNGRSTIAQADNLLKRVARHFGLLIRHDELPSRVAALRGGSGHMHTCVVAPDASIDAYSLRSDPWFATVSAANFAKGHISVISNT